MVLLHWDTKHDLGDACSIRCILSTLCHLSYTNLHVACTRQPDFNKRENRMNGLRNQADPEGRREQVNTLSSLFHSPSNACLSGL